MKSLKMSSTTNTGDFMVSRYLVTLPCGCVVYGSDADLGETDNNVPETEREPIITNVNCEKHNPSGYGKSKEVIE